MRKHKASRAPVTSPEGLASAVTVNVLAFPHLPAQEIAERLGLSTRRVMKTVEVIRAIDMQAVAELKPREMDLQTLLGTRMALKSHELLDSDPRTAVSLAFGAKLTAETRKVLAGNDTSSPRSILAFIENLDNRQVTVIQQNAETPAIPPMIIESESIQEVTDATSDNTHYDMVSRAAPMVGPDGMPTTANGDEPGVSPDLGQDSGGDSS